MIRTRLFLLCGLLGLAVPAVRAQAVDGRVLDAESHDPLSGATVFVPGLQRGVAADDEGRFHLPLPRPGTYRLVVSFIGFQNETRTLTVGAETVVLEVALRPTTIEAAPIVVTAKAQASDLLSTPQAVSVVDGTELAMRQGATAFEALEHTAGVHLLQTGAGLSKPVVRGLSAQRVLVVQNGVRQEGQQWGDEHAPELDAFDVERIEVVKGPASLLYGSDALGGVIQATSGDLFSYRQPLEGRLALQGLSNAQMGAAHLQLGGRASGLVYEGMLSARRGGSYENPDGVVPNTGVEERNGALRLGRTFGTGSMIAEYQHFGSRLGLFEPDEEIDPATDRYAIAEPYQRIAHDRLRLQVDLPVRGSRVDWSTAWQQNRRKEFGHHGEEGHEEEEDEAGALHEEEAPDLYLRLTTLTSDARLHHRPVGPVYGTLGLSGFVQHNETLAEEVLIPGARTWNGAVYAFEELTVPGLTVSGGVRFDARRLEVDEAAELGVAAQTRAYRALSGALGAAWQPLSGVSVAANVGRAWRAPVLVELFGDGVHEGTVRYERGDPDLDTEQSLSFDGTLRWLGRHAYVEVNGFVNRIDRFIYPRRTDEVDLASGYFVYQYDQAAARLWGGEVQAELHPHPLDWMHVRATGDLTLTRNVETGAPLPFSPPPTLHLEVEAEQAGVGPFDRIGARFGPTFVGRQDRVAPLEAATPGYVLWGGGVRAEFAFEHVTVVPLLAVDNLFDRAYVAHLSRFRPYDVLDPGRNIRLQVTFSLDP